MRCPVYRLCFIVERTVGDTVTIRPGKYLGIRGRAVEIVGRVLVDEFGCRRAGRSFTKYICPADRLRELCRVVKALSGGVVAV